MSGQGGQGRKDRDYRAAARNLSAHGYRVVRNAALGVLAPSSRPSSAAGGGGSPGGVARRSLMSAKLRQAIGALSGIGRAEAVLDVGANADALLRRADGDLLDRVAEPGATPEARVRMLLEAERARPEPRDWAVTLLARAEAAMRLARIGYAIEGPRAAPWGDPRRVGLFLHSRAPLVANGYAARAAEVARAVQGAGWHAQAVTRLGYPRDINRYAGAEVGETEAWEGTVCHALPDPAGGMRARPLDDYAQAYAHRAADALAPFAPSVLHAASSWHNGVAASIAARRMGAACVYEARGLWEVTALSRGDYGVRGEDDARYRLAARMEAEAARAADIVLALSEGLADALAGRGVAEAKIRVAPNCVPIEALPTDDQRAAARRELGVADEACCVAYMGSFAAYEGLGVLIEAAGRAAARGALIQLVLIGDGAASGEVDARLAGLPGLRATRLPRVAREDAQRLAPAGDVIALPRLDQPVTRIVPPIKAAEAMAAGGALIVSDVPALAELVVPGESGLVVPANDADALAEAIIRLAGDPALRARLGAAARTRAAERFSRQRLGQIITGAYEDALGVRG